VCLTDAEATVSRDDVANKLESGDKDAILDMIFHEDGVCTDPYSNVDNCFQTAEGQPGSEWDQRHCGCKDEYISMYMAGSWVRMNEAGCSSAARTADGGYVGDVSLAAVPSGMTPVLVVWLSLLIWVSNMHTRS